MRSGASINREWLSAWSEAVGMFHSSCASDGTSHSFFKWGGRVSREGSADSGNEILESGEGAPAPFRWSDEAQGPTVRYQGLRGLNALSASRRGLPFRPS